MRSSYHSRRAVSMRTWAFVGEKGGVGKSLLCVNLAVLAEQKGETTCIVDVDPQGSAKLWRQRRGGNQPMLTEATSERLVKVVEGAPDFGVKLVMIDTPGRLDAAILAAMRVADVIVCPTFGDLFSLDALERTVRLLEQAERLSRAVAVLNNIDEPGAKQTISEA